MLHLYFNHIPKTNENFSRVNEIAFNIFNSAKQNKENPVIKEFVIKYLTAEDI